MNSLLDLQMKIRERLAQYDEQVIAVREGAITIIYKMFGNRWAARVINFIS